jgi:hypothetical protein
LFQAVPLLLAATASPSHPCVGDYVYRASENDVSVGVRVRQEPDTVEVLFSDYDNIRAHNVVWNPDGTIAFSEKGVPDTAMVCENGVVILVLPAGEYHPVRLLHMRRVDGSLWDVGAREGWLKPED